jgi:hypothetical protein
MCHCVVGAAALSEQGSGGHGPANTVLPGQEGSGDEIGYNDKDGRRCHKGGGADDKSSCSTMQGDNNGSNDGGRDVTLRALYFQHCPLRV